MLPLSKYGTDDKLLQHAQRRYSSVIHQTDWHKHLIVLGEIKDGNALRDEIVAGIRSTIESAGSPAICHARTLRLCVGDPRRYVSRANSLSAPETASSATRPRA